MTDTDTRMAEHLGDWMRYPVKSTPNGWAVKLPGRKIGGVVTGRPIHYWRNGWLPMNLTPERDHAGGYGYPFRPDFRIHPGGFMTLGDMTSGIRSMGVMRRGQYVPIWRPGSFSVGDALMKQALGPYEVCTGMFDSAKQEIVLPHMPAIDGDDLVLDYWVDGMPPPERCPCKPVALDAAGREIPMKKWRHERGRYESIPLAVLDSLAFPVVLDPETNDAGWWAGGGNSSYAAARNTALSWGTQTCIRLGQTYYVATGTYGLYRFAVKFNLNAYPVDDLSAAWMKGCCCLTADLPLDDGTDAIMFSRADFVTWDPPDLFTIENVFDLIRTSTHGATLWTPDEIVAAGCAATPNCGCSAYYPLDAADVTWINGTLAGKVSPNRYVRAGLDATGDHNNVAPTGIECVFHGHRAAICGPWFKFEQGAGGGWVWLIS